MSRRRWWSATVLGGCAGGLLIVSLAGAAPNRPVGQALQFGIDWLARLDTFQEATLAYQRSIGPDVAWRASIGLAMEYEDLAYSLEYQAGDSIEASTDGTKWEHGVSIASEWLWYRGNNVSVFWGGGPRFSYSASRDIYWAYSIRDEEWRRERWQRSEFGGGVQGCLGVQWVAVEWLTIHAEYAARAAYFHQISEDKGSDGTESLQGEDHHGRSPVQLAGRAFWPVRVLLSRRSVLWAVGWQPNKWLERTMLELDT